jgi:site-specific DNA-cytosine methylase
MGVMQPIVVDRAAFNQGENAQYQFRAEHSETMDSLVARGPHAVLQPIPIHDQATRHAGKNGNKTMGKGNGIGIGHPGEPMNTLTKGDRHAVAQPIAFTTEQTPKYNHDQALTLTKQSPTGGGQPQCVAQPICLMDQGGSVMNIEHDMTGTLRRETHGHEPIVIHGTQDPCVSDIAFAKGRNNGGENVMVQSMAVRRLTPTECERLQGFPDSYTDIKSKNKPTPDGPRYKALGNSMAVPVMAWIGKRIEQVEAICKQNK